MSGGVDSSVTALILKEQGYRVIGLFMKNWDEKDENGVCRSAQEYEDVTKVCEQLVIPCYAVNFVKEYWDNVFEQFVADFKKGFTPNPDVLCNREIKFKVFLDKAMALGADFLATGHYCRNEIVGGKYALLKGVDPDKDQSYFLYTMQQDALKKVLFPIGGMKKSAVKKIAAEHGLATAGKKKSWGSVSSASATSNHSSSQYIASEPGNFEDVHGKVIGRHSGIAFYTLGQRKGLGIGGPGEAWFVVAQKTSNVMLLLSTKAPTIQRCIRIGWSPATYLGWRESRQPFPSVAGRRSAIGSLTRSV